MKGSLALVFACLVGQSDPRPLDPDATFDVSKVDADPTRPEPDAERERPALLALTAREAAAGDELQLEPGGAVVLPSEIPLPRAPSGPIVLRLRSARGVQLEIGPPLASATAALAPRPPGPEPSAPKKRRKKTRVRKAPELWVAQGRYFVRSPPLTSGPAPASGLIEVLELESGRVLARRQVELKARIVETALEPAAIGQLETAAAHFAARQRESETALKAQIGSPVPLSPERLQPGQLSAESLALITRLLEDSWRREVARGRLRALTLSPNAALAEAAMLALGRLAPRTEATGREPSQEEPAKELAAIRAQLSELAIERAERGVSRLRRRSDLSRDELGELLALDGALAALRGEAEAAKKSFGQALCLDPSRSSPDLRPPAGRLFEEVKSDARCAVALHANAPEAYLTSTPAGTELHVRVTVGPDPYGVVAGGAVLLYGGGGGVLAEEKVRAEGADQRTLVAAFPDDPGFRNMAGELLVQVVAKSVSGVPLASVGDPVPVRLLVGEHEDYSAGVPWWVWVGGGILVLAGAGVTTFLLVPKEEVRGIGPIDVTF